MSRPPDQVASPRSRRRLETAREARLRRKRLVRYGLVIASVVLLVHALFGENGYLATIRAEREYATAEQELAAVRQENRRLEQTIDRLDHDPAALEEAAREQLRMVKPGEKLLILKDPPEESAQGRR